MFMGLFARLIGVSSFFFAGQRVGDVTLNGFYVATRLKLGRVVCMLKFRL